MSSIQAPERRRAIITLTTDFGLHDWYVAVMKGVILSINPDVQIVDTSHLIPAGDIPHGAFLLHQAAREFRPDTIHVAVVDPGVGSPRTPILAKSDRGIFIGPHNGLFDRVFAESKSLEIFELTPNQFVRPNPSRTFHGRDIFAPTAAHYSLGVSMNELGTPHEGAVLKTDGEVRPLDNHSLRGEIVYIDHYGNAISSIPAPPDWSPERYSKVLLNRQNKTVPTGDYYATVKQGEFIAVIGSGNHIEISRNLGHAAEALDLIVGDQIELIGSDH